VKERWRTFGVKSFGCSELSIDVAVASWTRRKERYPSKTSQLLCEADWRIEKKEARHVHDHPSLLITRGRCPSPRLRHEIKCELSCELDESVVSSFGDDEDIADIGSDSRST
jgi:hypothetical protein